MFIIIIIWNKEIQHERYVSDLSDVAHSVDVSVF